MSWGVGKATHHVSGARQYGWQPPRIMTGVRHLHVCPKEVNWEMDRERDEADRFRRRESEDDDVQGHRFSEDLSGGDDVVGHAQPEEEEDVAGHITPPQSRPGAQP
jgi:hypothetical protein